MKKDTNNLGLLAEDKAAIFLEQAGYRILERRFRCRGGELDIICEKGTVLVFVEVRYRACLQYGSPLETVGLEKRRRLSRAIGIYLSAQGGRFENYCYRCDVVAVSGPIIAPKIEHYENAFVPYFG